MADALGAERSSSAVGLIYAAVDDLRTRTVGNIVCIVIALAGLITISPASLLGALLAMLPFYLCAGFGLMGGGDWRLGLRR
ncbi:MAG: A24 family peptidase [Acutalibacteraceae bacterium]